MALGRSKEKARPVPGFFLPPVVPPQAAQDGRNAAGRWNRDMNCKHRLVARDGSPALHRHRQRFVACGARSFRFVRFSIASRAAAPEAAEPSDGTALRIRQRLL
jgi:hypothetical protein